MTKFNVTTARFVMDPNLTQAISPAGRRRAQRAQAAARRENMRTVAIVLTLTIAIAAIPLGFLVAAAF